MPWSEDDVAEHNQAAADDPEKRRQWVSVANHVLSETGDDARAIRTANAAVAEDDTGHSETADDPVEKHDEEHTKKAGLRRPHSRFSKGKEGSGLFSLFGKAKYS